jgi:hypothetical protein
MTGRYLLQLGSGFCQGEVQGPFSLLHPGQEKLECQGGFPRPWLAAHQIQMSWGQPTLENLV